MENLLNIFVRSIFIDNMILPILSMCSYLGRIEDCEDPLSVLGIDWLFRIVHHRSGQPILVRLTIVL